jgi:hypothetical protein
MPPGSSTPGYRIIDASGVGHPPRAVFRPLRRREPGDGSCPRIGAVFPRKPKRGQARALHRRGATPPRATRDGGGCRRMLLQGCRMLLQGCRMLLQGRRMLLQGCRMLLQGRRMLLQGRGGGGIAPSFRLREEGVGDGEGPSPSSRRRGPSPHSARRGRVISGFLLGLLPAGTRLRRGQTPLIGMRRNPRPGKLG